MVTPKLLRRLMLIVALGLPAPAFADSSAEAFVKARQTELLGLIKQGGASKAGTGRKIESVFDAMLDYDALAQDSLGRKWDERTPKEREEFQNLLKQLVQRSYRKNLDRTANYDVEYRGESSGKGNYLVKTTAKSRTNMREEPITIDYVVHKVDGSWRVRDIITEGSSLVKNYRQQFGRIIKKNGFEDLLQRMKKKLESDEV